MTGNIARAGAAVIVLALAVLALRLQCQGEEGGVEALRPPTAEVAGGATAPQALEDAGGPSPRASFDLEPDSGAGSDFGMLALIFQWSDGAPAAHVGFELLDGGGLSREHAVYAYTDGSGRYGPLRLRAGTLLLVFDRAPVERRLEILAGRTNEEVVRLPRGLDVHGRVVDESGRAVAEAKVWGSSDGRWDPYRPLAVSDAAGEFDIRSLDPAYSLFATATSYGPSELVRPGESADRPGGNESSVELVVRAAGAAVAGLVVSPAGEVVESARVRVKCTASVADGQRAPDVVVLSDGQGRYEVTGLAPGRAYVVVDGPGFPLYVSERIELLAGRTVQADVRLQWGASVGGLVTRDSAPLEGVQITHVLGLPFPTNPFEPYYVLSAETGSDGRYRLNRLPPGDVTLTARQRGGGTLGFQKTTLTAAPGNMLVWNVEFVDGLALIGRAEHESGRPIAGWRVSAIPLDFDNATFPKDVITDGQGRFRIENCFDVPHTVRLFAPGEGVASAEQGPVRPGPQEVLLRVAAATQPSAFVLGLLQGPRGEPVARAGIVATREPRGPETNAKSGADGSFRLGPLAPGSYTVRILDAELGHAVFEQVVLEAEEERDLGVIVFEQVGFVEVWLELGAGAVVENPSAKLLGPALMGYSLRPVAPNRLKSPGLPPGRYRLCIVADNAAAPMREVDVLAGETTSLPVAMEAGQRLAVTCVAEQDAGVLRVQIEIRGGNELYVSRTVPISSGASKTGMVVCSLPRGEYEYVVTWDPERRGTGSFSVDASTGREVRIELE